MTGFRENCKNVRFDLDFLRTQIGHPNIRNGNIVKNYADYMR